MQNQVVQNSNVVETDIVINKIDSLKLNHLVELEIHVKMEMKQQKEVVDLNY